MPSTRNRPQDFEGEESPEQDMGPKSLQQEIAEVEKEVVSEEATSPADVYLQGELADVLSAKGGCRRVICKGSCRCSFAIGSCRWHKGKNP
jgi:hypothetical protein